MKTLKEIAELSSGLVISRKSSQQEDKIVKTYKQLNLKAIDKDGYIDLNQLEYFNSKEFIDENYLTKENTIVVRLTEPFTAIYIRPEFENIVISSNFCIIKVNSNYSAKYISHYLNSTNVKKFLLTKTQSSVMKNISMTTLSEVQIPSISLSKQNQVAKLIDCILEKNRLNTKINKLEDLVIKELLK